MQGMFAVSGQDILSKAPEKDQRPLQRMVSKERKEKIEGTVTFVAVGKTEVDNNY